MSWFAELLPYLTAGVEAAILLMAVRAGLRLVLEDGRNQRGALLRTAARDRTFRRAGWLTTGQIDLNVFSPAEITRSPIVRHNFWGALCKRALDVAASLFLLIAAGPVLVLAAALIKLDTPGPVLYRQTRVGFGGRIFEVYKFRTMHVDAEPNGAQWAAASDARVTRIGRILRKTHIDEIPQAINVLKGEMSFVGPRPERPELVRLIEQEIPHYHERHRVKPGITGWAQVKYAYGASIEDAREKLKFDLFYLKHGNPLFDLVIILMTLRVALLGIGSR